MKRVYKRIRKTHPPSCASKFKESSRDKLQSRDRKYVAYNPFLAFHRSLSASYYRLHWIQKSEGWIIIAGNVNSTMAETLASATPLFERSPIVDVAVQRRRNAEGSLAPSLAEQRVEIEWRNDPLLRVFRPAGRMGPPWHSIERQSVD